VGKVLCCFHVEIPHMDFHFTRFIQSNTFRKQSVVTSVWFFVHIITFITNWFLCSSWAILFKVSNPVMIMSINITKSIFIDSKRSAMISGHSPAITIKLPRQKVKRDYIIQLLLNISTRRPWMELESRRKNWKWMNTKNLMDYVENIYMKQQSADFIMKLT